jgi:glycosyltransferase involved in cell wall biosynthesis
MKVAIVHDWLTLTGGAERVLEQLLDLFPDADLFCTVEFLPEEDLGLIAGRTVRTSFIQKLPFARRAYRKYLPLMPIAVEQFDLSAYDLVLSSSHAVAKGVITGPDQVHLCYIYSPIRYAWDLQHAYLKEAGVRGLSGLIARMILHYIRIWDVRTSHGVDRFVAISHFVSRRVRKAYGRVSSIVYPPVDIARFQPQADKEDFYLTASRMVPYKRMPLIVEAFARMPERRLVVIGDGPDMDLVRAAAGPNVEVMGRQSDAVMTDYMGRTKAFLYAAEEDFGIVPLEAQACGTPVIAYSRGGSLETIRGHDGPAQTGVFFAEQSIEAIVAAVRHLDTRAIRPEDCRANAERFSTQAFRDGLMKEVGEAMDRHRQEACLGR